MFEQAMLEIPRQARNDNVRVILSGGIAVIEESQTWLAYNK